MANYQDIAQQFVNFYYQTFDVDRKELLSLYRDSSMSTFESSATQGAQPIIEKLVNLPFQKVKHEVATLDAQPSVNNGIVVLVTGSLLTEGESRPMSYTQVFQLLPEGGSYYVHNDIFKLVYPSDVMVVLDDQGAIVWTAPQLTCSQAKRSAA